MLNGNTECCCCFKDPIGLDLTFGEVLRSFLLICTSTDILTRESVAKLTLTYLPFPGSFHSQPVTQGQTVLSISLFSSLPAQPNISNLSATVRFPVFCLQFLVGHFSIFFCLPRLRTRSDLLSPSCLRIPLFLHSKDSSLWMTFKGIPLADPH